MILENKEKPCNRMKGRSRCIQKINADKCPAEGGDSEEKKKNCKSGVVRIMA